jgi:hypothetical protein
VRLQQRFGPNTANGWRIDNNHGSSPSHCLDQRAERSGDFYDARAASPFATVKGLI